MALRRTDPNEKPLEAFDAAALPLPRGINNAGNTCYLNSTLQMLASCPSVMKAILDNEDYLRQTETGTALHWFARAYTDGAGQEDASRRLATALIADLGRRQPQIQFVAGMQQCVSEVIPHIFSMATPPAPDERQTPGWNNPVAKKMYCHHRSTVICRRCGYRLQKYLHTLLWWSTTYHETEEELVKSFQMQGGAREGYKCDKCGVAEVDVVEQLQWAPEVILIFFRKYLEKRNCAFPEEFSLRGTGGESRVYRLVATVSHSGTPATLGPNSQQGSGHYTAEGLRRPAGGASSSTQSAVYTFSDISAREIDRFSHNNNIVMLAYHFAGVRADAQSA